MDRAYLMALIARIENGEITLESLPDEVRLEVEEVMDETTKI